MPTRPLLPLVLLSVLVAPATAAQPPSLASGDAGMMPILRRHLLQAAGPESAVIINLATNGEPVYCINITQPFQDRTYGASGTEQPSGGDIDALASLICSDQTPAGTQIYEAIKAGGAQAKGAAQAVKMADRCPQKAADSVNVAATLAQDTLPSLSAIESFFQSFVDALQAVGVPACVTLIESDASGEKVATEKYFRTG